MTPDSFLSHLKRLGYGTTSFAKLLDVDRKTVTRWGNGFYPVPVSVQMLLRGEKIEAKR